MQGGWGSARLLERSLALPAGWLLGFSDVTSLLWGQVAQGRGGGVHGPLVTTLAAEPAWSRERLRALLFGEPLDPLEGSRLAGGVATGPLLVANLTVATHLLGTRHLPTAELSLASLASGIQIWRENAGYRKSWINYRKNTAKM